MTTATHNAHDTTPARVLCLTFRTLFPEALRVFSRSAIEHAWTGHSEPLQNWSLSSFLTS